MLTFYILFCLYLLNYELTIYEPIVLSNERVLCWLRSAGNFPDLQLLLMCKGPGSPHHPLTPPPFSPLSPPPKNPIQRPYNHLQVVFTNSISPLPNHRCRQHTPCCLLTAKYDLCIWSAVLKHNMAQYGHPHTKNFFYSYPHCML